jgi:hypothetical protein
MGQVTNYVYDYLKSVKQLEPSYYSGIYFIQLGRLFVKLVFFCKDLEALFLPALQKILIADTIEAKTTIYIINESCITSSLPNASWGANVNKGAPAESIWQSYGVDIQLLHQPGIGKMKFYCSSKSKAVYSITSLDCILPWERPAPLRDLFHWISCDNEMILLHAACVAHKNKGILLSGAGGSGKSTTSLLLAMSGMDFISDDYCLVDLSGVPMAYHLYSSGKFFNKDRNMYNTIIEQSKEMVYELPNNKMAVLIDEYPNIRLNVPIHGIISISKSDETISEIENQSKLQAFIQLGPSTLKQAKGKKVYLKNQISKLVNTVPLRMAKLGVNTTDRITVLKSFF